MRMPILATVKETLAMCLAMPGQMLKSLFVMIAMFIAGAVVLMVLGVVAAVIFSLAGGGSEGSLGGVTALIVGTIAGIVMIPITAFIFNAWVRVGAEARDRVDLSQSSDNWRGAIKNAWWFLLIFLILGVISFAVSELFSAIGLSVPLDEGLALDSHEQYLATFSASIVALVVQCFVYSYFSGTLTRNALGIEKGQFHNPYLVDFAVALLILGGLLHLIALPLAMLGAPTLYEGVTLLFSLFLIFPLAAVHGVRYRFAVAQGQAGDNVGDTPSP